MNWRKSSHSGTADNCLEVKDGVPDGAVPVRDSKCPEKPVLVFGAKAWAAFVAQVQV